MTLTDTEALVARRITRVSIFAGSACLAAAAAYLLLRGEPDRRLLVAALGGLAATLSLFVVPLELRVKVVLALASAAATAFAFSAALSAIDQLRPEVETPERTQAAAAAETGADFDRRSRLEVLLDLRRRGEAAYPVFFPYQWAWYGMPEAFADGLLPLGGVSGRLAVSCNETGERLVYRADEHGFHNPPGLYRPGEVAIAAVGDSFVLGKCVASDDNAVAWLRAGYRGDGTVLGLGAGGNGPLLDLALVREYVEPLAPELVLWFHYEGNDVRNLKKEMRSAVLQPYLEPGYRQRLIERQAEIDRRLGAWLDQQVEAARRQAGAPDPEPAGGFSLRRWLADALLLRGIRSLLDLEAGDTVEPSTAEAIARFEQILALADERIASGGGRLVFVYLPEWCRLAGAACEEQHRDEVLAMVDRLGIGIVDLLPVFAGHPDPVSLFPFRLQGHYTAAGYRLVAESVLEALAAGGVDRGS